MTEQFEVGDRIRAHTEGTIVDTEPRLGYTHPALLLESGAVVYLDNYGWSYDKLAPKKPPVGTVITAKQVWNTPWKRGTVITAVHVLSDGRRHSLMLKADGKWVRDDGQVFAFNDFFDGASKYTVSYLPDNGR